MKFSRPIIIYLALTAFVVAIGAGVWAYPRVRGEITLELHYSNPVCGGESGGALTAPTWDQMTPAQRAFSYDKVLPEQVFMAGVLWRQTGDSLLQRGVNLSEPIIWRNNHVSIRAGEVFRSATGEIACRYEIRFSGVSPELATQVLAAAEHTYREHVFKRDSEMTTDRILKLEAQIAKLESPAGPADLPHSESEKAQPSLAECRRELAEAREDLRLKALRRNLSTAKLL